MQRAKTGRAKSREQRQKPSRGGETIKGGGAETKPITRFVSESDLLAEIERAVKETGGQLPEYEPLR